MVFRIVPLIIPSHLPILFKLYYLINFTDLNLIKYNQIYIARWPHGQSYNAILRSPSNPHFSLHGLKAGGKYAFTFTFTFMHLADAFIQSDLHCIQVTVFTFYQLLCAFYQLNMPTFTFQIVKIITVTLIVNQITCKVRQTHFPLSAFCTTVQSCRIQVKSLQLWLKAKSWSMAARREKAGRNDCCRKRGCFDVFFLAHCEYDGR